MTLRACSCSQLGPSVRSSPFPHHLMISVFTYDHCLHASFHYMLVSFKFCCFSLYLLANSFTTRKFLLTISLLEIKNDRINDWLLSSLSVFRVMSCSSNFHWWSMKVFFLSHYELRAIYILDIFQWITVIIHFDARVDPLVSPLVFDNFFGFWHKMVQVFVYLPFPKHGASHCSKEQVF